MLVYLILFFASFYRFRKSARIFSQYPFNNLPGETYKIYETKPFYLFFLASLTIKGTSKDYPVRIECENDEAIIVVGIQTDSKDLKSILATEGLSLNDLGVIKALKINSLLNKGDPYKLNDEIEKITDFLRKNNVPKY
jgi:hypothetical protein